MGLPIISTSGRFLVFQSTFVFTILRGGTKGIKKELPVVPISASSLVSRRYCVYNLATKKQRKGIQQADFLLGVRILSILQG